MMSSSGGSGALRNAPIHVELAYHPAPHGSKLCSQKYARWFGLGRPAPRCGVKLLEVPGRASAALAEILVCARPRVEHGQRPLARSPDVICRRHLDRAPRQEGVVLLLGGEDPRVEVRAYRSADPFGKRNCLAWLRAGDSLQGLKNIALCVVLPGFCPVYFLISLSRHG